VSGKRNRGYAFVEVESGRAAMEALDSTELRLHGRQFVVNEAHPLAEKDERRRETDLPRVDLSERLYLGNLPYSATEATVQSLFESHGLHPLEIYLAFDRQAGRAKGFAFAAMASSEEAARAIGALNGSIVDGRSIVVRPAAPRTRLGDEA
jgi:RNA recognition motif-containing protein